MKVKGDDDIGDLFRRLTKSRLADRESAIRAGLNRIVIEQTVKGALKSGATLIRLRQQGEDEILHRASILIEAAKEILAGSPISALEGSARACKSIAESIINASYAEIWQLISDVEYVGELLVFKANSAAALQWHLAGIRNLQVDRATIEVDLFVRSRLASRAPPKPENLRRRLAAIVALDVAGYSTRMEVDEADTVTEILELHELAGAIATEHSGRVFNTAGDGIMIEFPSATDAVEAGGALKTRSKLPIRVGIHIAEVSGEGDLLAHAVNVAARLMQAALQDQVVVSSDACRLIRGPIRQTFVPLGKVKMKNMEEAIEAYCLDRLPD